MLIVSMVFTNLARLAVAVVVTWVGEQGATWQNGDNWDPTNIPDADDSVIIDKPAHYWQYDTLRFNIDQNADDDEHLFDHIAGEPFKSKGVQMGDVVYGWTFHRGKLMVFGRMVTGKLGSVFFCGKKTMRKFVLVVVLAGLFTGSIDTGSSYQQRDGTVVDPSRAC